MGPLQFLYFLQPSHEALTAAKLRAEKGPDELAGELGADDLGTDAEHVHVVVLDSLVSGVGVVAGRTPDTRDLAGGDRRANARAADENTALGLAGPNRLTHLARLVRVVDLRLRCIRAEVDRLVAGPDDLLQHAFA